MVKITGSTRSGALVRGIAQIEKDLGVPTGDLARKSGIAQRSTIGAGNTQISMGCGAAWSALAKAGADISEVDLLISAASVSHQLIPTTSAFYAYHLGARDGALETMDINTTCLSFLTAMKIAIDRVDQGAAQKVLIISSETPSQSIPLDEDPLTGVIFSDGAAAVLIEAGEGFRLKSYKMRTYASGIEACQIRSGGTRYPGLHFPEELVEEHRFRMNGDHLMSLTARKLPGFIETFLDEAGLTRADIDIVLPHQASPLALGLLKRLSGFDGSCIADYAAIRGNRVAASLPDSLITHMQDDAWPDRGRALMVGTSAGVSFGAALLEFG